MGVWGVGVKMTGFLSNAVYRCIPMGSQKPTAQSKVQFDILHQQLVNNNLSPDQVSPTRTHNCRGVSQCVCTAGAALRRQCLCIALQYTGSTGVCVPTDHPTHTVLREWGAI